MIDRQARDILAEQLRHLISCQITNDEFDDAVSWSRHDPGVVAVYGMAWRLYDDLYEHRMTGLHHVPKQGRHEIARWILFLQSDLAYEWPPYNFVHTVNSPLNFVTLGWWDRRMARRFAEVQAAGDWDVWPFFRRADFETARQEPRLLAGKAR
jgi:hypothetical protein